MTDAMKQHGIFSWNELMTTDIEGAKQFYSQLLGWQLEAMPSPDMPYTMAKVGDTMVAGLMAIPQESAGMPPVWGAYVTVDDVDSSAEQAEQLGGKVLMPPTDIPKVGRCCVIQDPQGASLMLITYSMEEFDD